MPNLFVPHKLEQYSLIIEEARSCHQRNGMTSNESMIDLADKIRGVTKRMISTTTSDLDSDPNGAFNVSEIEGWAARLDFYVGLLELYSAHPKSNQFTHYGEAIENLYTNEEAYWHALEPLMAAEKDINIISSRVYEPRSIEGILNNILYMARNIERERSIVSIFVENT